MANNIQELLNALKPKEEEQLFSPIASTQDQLMSPMNPTPEQLASIKEQQQVPELETPVPVQPVMKQASPKKDQPSTNSNQDTDSTSPETPLSAKEKLMQEYLQLSGKDNEELKQARERDRMLKIGGSIGDALATYLNAQSQMRVKAPGVQVQQGAGLGKVADMFATAPEITSDIAAKREALMKQYGELAKGERAEKRLTSEEKLAKDRMAQQERLAQMQIEGNLKAAGIRASGKGGLTPYQQYMMSKSEKKEAKLSDKQTAELEGLGNVMRSLDEVESAKSGVNTGRYASAYQSGKEALPFSEADQDFVKLRQLSGTQLFDYVKAQSGVSYSVKELEQLKQNMPNVEDDDNTFLTKLNTVRDIVKRKQEEKVKAFQGQGKNVSGFEKQVPTKKASPGDIVTVKGKKYRVAEDGDSLIPVGQ
jgi:hypothetical protein